MIVSEKQQAANRQNAQQSTGPKTPEGKAAVRFNALTWGLRARSLMLKGDNPADYQELWDHLEADWQPQDHTERYYLEQMTTAQWLLTRTAVSETRIRQSNLSLGRELVLLARVGAQRAQLERSFTTSMHELKQLQKERQARSQPQPAPTTRAAKTEPPKPAQPNVPQPAYVMSEAAQDHPVHCAPLTTDTR